MASRIFKNIWLKITALILAFLTWLGVHYSMEMTESFIYTVQVMLPSNVKAKEVYPEAFSVSVSGQNEAIKEFRSLKHVYIIDLSSIKEDEAVKRIISIDKNLLNIPSSLKINSISDDKINILLDPLVQKELTVECDIVDKPAPGYIISGISVRPSRIPMILPSKEAISISKIMTVPISVSSSTSSIVDRVALVNPLDPSKRLDLFADITIVIQPDFLEIEFKDIPVAILCAPNDKREIILNSDKISVTLRGRRDAMETFDKSKIKVYLDVVKQEEGDFELQPVVQPIEGISIIKVQPVRYTIKQ